MAGKDLSEKKLEDYNDVFADILNTLLFKKDLILPSLLEDGPSESVYKAAEKNLRGQYRDTFKYYKKAGIMLAGFGMENETEEEDNMPVRVMGYDYSAYKKQCDAIAAKNKKQGVKISGEYLSGIKKTDRIYPVITVVVYYGQEPLDGPVSLYGMFGMPEELKSFINDFWFIL